MDPLNKPYSEVLGASHRTGPAHSVFSKKASWSLIVFQKSTQNMNPRDLFFFLEKSTFSEIEAIRDVWKLLGPNRSYSGSRLASFEIEFAIEAILSQFEPTQAPLFQSTSFRRFL